jgi:hypothetical protein
MKRKIKNIIMIYYKKLNSLLKNNINVNQNNVYLQK